MANKLLYVLPAHSALQLCRVEGSPPAPREPVPGPVNCFTYCLLVYNPPSPLPTPTHPSSYRQGLSWPLCVQSTPKSSFDISFRTHFLEACPGKGGEIQTGGGKGEGGLKGRWQGHSSEPGTAAGGRASMHCSYQPSPPQTLAGLSLAKHYCAYSTAEAVEFGH